MKHSQKTSGGYWMLAGLFALLAAPLVIDYIVHGASANASVHADAGASATN